MRDLGAGEHVGVEVPGDREGGNTMRTCAFHEKGPGGSDMD